MQKGLLSVCVWKEGTAGSWIVDGKIRLSHGEPAMPYRQLTIEEREVISQMHYSGAGPSAIGRRLGRSAGTFRFDDQSRAEPQQRCGRLSGRDGS